MKKSFLFLILLATVAGCSDQGVEKNIPKKETVSAPGKITIVVPKNQPQVQPSQDPFRTYDIQGQSIIKYAPEGQTITEEVKNVQVVVAARNNPYGNLKWKLLGKRLSKDFILYCSACHDDYGNGVVGPSLIDKNAREVLETMNKYLNDPDANALMTELVQKMSKEKTEFIASDIARFNKEISQEKHELLGTKDVKKGTL